MKFPTEEEKIVTLGQKMSGGFQANSDIHPAPPINTLELDEALTAYAARRDEAVAARAITAKQETLQMLADKIKTNLRYAEMAVNFDDDKLQAIGWGGRREKTPLAPPGQAPNLVAAEQGVRLDQTQVGQTR
uniref:Uncharacterized protein n=1 Tax=Candidatus Kentrum eta TaxID=2126337 RepID=A0A450VBZ3_9GAMM|nr:MAG: hypothetical protein BECKH772A_GA0070896_100563 [Candidatus Kentron sp. H]VFJ94088.1 MAG: hypothetical protein BECKH772B_GA0070898_100554 [Candidatus Kentron sp. H]VFK02284.1 MAG: hypothetical protein BECKH772C_GA0070978_1008611 [Candidatus Kentron sp. H]